MNSEERVIAVLTRRSRLAKDQMTPESRLVEDLKLDGDDAVDALLEISKECEHVHESAGSEHECAALPMQEGVETMVSQNCKTVVALILLLAGAAFASTDRWQRFSSSNHFSVLYPAAWVRNGASTDRLQLRSSAGGAEGIGIKQGQAEITVMEAQESSKQTLAQVIVFYTQDTTVLSRKDVAGETASSGCSELKEVISKEPAVPPGDSTISVPTIINTDFFCEVQGRKIVTLLRNWEGDKRQQEYQQVALRMAKGIHVASQEGNRINELEGAASTAGTVANLLNTASAAYDIYQCYQTK